MGRPPLFAFDRRLNWCHQRGRSPAGLALHPRRWSTSASGCPPWRSTTPWCWATEFCSSVSRLHGWSSAGDGNRLPRTLAPALQPCQPSTLPNLAPGPSHAGGFQEPQRGPQPDVYVLVMALRGSPALPADSGSAGLQLCRMQLSRWLKGADPRQALLRCSGGALLPLSCRCGC
jgi:hypothetical protein